jgi:hypothetical protein
MLIAFVASRAGAQTVDTWPGAAPGSETWMQKETTVEDTPLGSVVFSVVTPTLTAYLPEKAKATVTWRCSIDKMTADTKHLVLRIA